MFLRPPKAKKIGVKVSVISHVRKSPSGANISALQLLSTEIKSKKPSTCLYSINPLPRYPLTIITDSTAVLMAVMM